jgi:hypothetical protein
VKKKKTGKCCGTTKSESPPKTFYTRSHVGVHDAFLGYRRLRKRVLVEVHLEAHIRTMISLVDMIKGIRMECLQRTLLGSGFLLILVGRSYERFGCFLWMEGMMSVLVSLTLCCHVCE